MLHLTNGDCAAAVLRQSGIPGEVIVWADVLHEGPVPPGHGAEWRRTRAEYLSSAGYGSANDTLEWAERWDAALERYREHDELVLWFEHDLFDQLLLARHLHWLGTQGHVSTRLSLICIDRFPGVARFDGLGQLTPDQLARLFPVRQEISGEQMRTGADVWRAFTATTPGSLAAAVSDGLIALPFMAGALARLLEEFPDAQDGLSRTERTVLEELAAGPKSPDALFADFQRREERVFMADTTFWMRVRGMARGSEPLVAIAIHLTRDGRLPEGTVAIAPSGRRVLDDGADAVVLRGVDRWVGGVHLTAGAVWRWDRGRRQLVPPGA